MSVDFDPVRLDRKRRRLDPLVIGSIVVVFALVLAIAKPWNGQGTSSPLAQTSAKPSPTASVGSASGTPPANAAVDPVRPPPSPDPIAAYLPDWPALAGLVTVHDAWGVRAIRTDRLNVAPNEPSPRYAERWAPTETNAAGTEFAFVEPGRRTIAVLGITAPRAAEAQDARIWRVHRHDRLEWVDTVQIGPGATDASFLFVRSGADGPPDTGWEPGTYRIDVLTARGIRHIEARIPTRSGDVPPPDDWAVSEAGLVPASAIDPFAIGSGLFATVDGSAVSLEATESRVLSPGSAWHDTALAGGKIVATAYLPRATGLGVTLARGEDITGSEIRRLAPDGSFEAPAPIPGMSDRQGGLLYVLFPAAEGAWLPGTYAITVDWTDQTGAHEGTWHVELRPGLG
ncbi:MAG: hypothetical protein E4H24_03825 [Thermomicrobiales bacterium]|jgi:hypothetical protein|nr:MAG: hypothetical protein E4H24_03825 [Thermomicrobiales bacterium]